ncbi:MAG TPA: dephospho-CoA kinase [Dehalococcoidia bacterium]|jgi:dephospho-CoA kinase|nr:dephospho-CoA kinase [Dehalococcoidia bacterium]
MIVIGLTGGIGSGKSTVSQMLAELGAVVIDVDRLGHEALSPHTEAWQEVVTAFGSEILKPDGEIDRARLAQKVFGDAQAIERLNRIMHPRMYRLAQEKLARLEEEGVRVVVMDTPLLFEAHWTPLVDEVWVTYAPQEKVVERLRRRSGLSESEVRERLGHQMSPEEKARRGNRVIDTGAPLAEVKAQVEKLWRELMASGEV